MHTAGYEPGKTSVRPAFTLSEVAAALVILGLVTSSVFVVINRCIASTANLALRMHAFEVARDNMEVLLSVDSIKEMVEYGASETYPEIEWEVVVESFNEPTTSDMWVQAVCSATYIDTSGEEQKIELTHWITRLTDEQIEQIAEQKEREREWLAEQGLDEAALEAEQSESDKRLDERKRGDRGEQDRKRPPGLGPNPTMQELLKFINEHFK